MSDWILHNARCQDILPGEYAGKVDLVVTSPPYDGLRSYGGYADAWDFEAIAPAIVASLADGGVLVWVSADQIIGGGESLTSFRHAIAFQDLGLRMHQSMVFERWSINGMSADKYFRSHEYMFVFSNGKPKTANMLRDRRNVKAGMRVEKSAAGRQGDRLDPYTGDYRDGVYAPAGKRGSIWDYTAHIGGCFTGSRMGSKSERHLPLQEHPAGFPYALAADHIRSWSAEGDLVLDPMAGSGTTGRAAVDLGRRAAMIEVNPAYCDLIRRRMAQEALL